jgi:hypothetical protein
LNVMEIRASMGRIRAALAVRRTRHVRLPEFLGVLALAAFVCVGAYTDINFLVLMHLPVFQDLDIYLAACRAGLHGGNVYANLSLGYGFLYPLPSLLLMLPMASLPHDFIRVVLYDGVSIALLVLLVRAVAHRFSLSFRQTYWWYILALGFAPVFENLELGQINLFPEACLLLVWLYTPSKPLIGGFGLASAIALKLSPVVFLLYPLIVGSWATLAYALLFLVGESGLSGLIFGWTNLHRSINVLQALPNAFSPGDGNGQAFVSVLNYNGFISLGQLARAQSYLNFYMAIILCLGTWLAFRLRQHDVGFIILAFGTAVLPNIMWYHHYVYLLLPIFVLLGVSRLHMPVVLWCGALMLDIQIERWHATRGLTTHLMVHLTLLALLCWLGRRLFLARRRAVTLGSAVSAD